MNTANLQLEGLVLALGALLEAIERKGLLDRTEILEALAVAERRAAGDAARPPEVSGANVEAVLFPIRFLARSLARGEGERTFSEIARSVGLAR